MFQNQKTMESYLTAKRGVESSDGGYISDSALNLADGEVAFLGKKDGSYGIGEFVNEMDFDSQIFSIIQGLPTLSGTSHPYPLPNWKYLEGGTVETRNITGIYEKTGMLPTLQTYYLVFGDIDETVDTKISIVFSGTSMNNIYSVHNRRTLDITIPAFDAGTMTEAQKRDYMYQMIGHEINMNSKKFGYGNLPIMAVAIPSTGGTDIGGLAEGDDMPIFTTEGVTHNIPYIGAQSLSTTYQESFAVESAADEESSYIIAVNASNAGTGSVAGLGIIALDRDLVYNDRVSEVKVSIDIVTKGNIDTGDTLTLPSEGTGIGRVLDLEWRQTHGQRIFANHHRQTPVIEFPSSIVRDELYDVYTIHHTKYTRAGLGTIEVPMAEHILIPSFQFGAQPIYTANLQGSLQILNGGLVPAII